MKKGGLVALAIMGFSVFVFLPQLLGQLLAPRGVLIGDRYINAALLFFALSVLVFLLWALKREHLLTTRARSAGAAEPAAWRFGSILGLLLFGGALACVEMSLYATRKTAGGPVETMEGTFGKEFGEVSIQYGFRLRPRQNARSIKKLDGKLVYDAIYTTDENGLRSTVQPSAEHKESFLLFFGASWVFGEGVSDGETLPSHTAKLLPNTRVYNFATAGYGPQHLLASLEDPAKMAAIREKRGTLVYVIDDSAVERTIGSLYVYGSWGPNLPFYRPDVNGTPVRDGNFTTGRPFTSLFYLFLSRSQIVKRLRFNLPRIQDEHIGFTARVVAEAGRRFKEAYPLGQFRVLFYPDQTSVYRLRMLAHLKRHGIETLDYLDVIPFSPLPDNPYAIRGDGHPLSTTHEAVARRLASDLATRRVVFNR